ncbi:hypothetical protein J3R83DRAFT_4565 [Lanmaoa asiatica]|nr:hypothetical protein J3R83DRAFT_4565 [Lanmaoa asiatica]
MRQTRPLPDTHPEFTVLYWPGFTEYRVEHWRLARDGSGRIVRGTCIWSWVDGGVLAVVVVVWVLLTRIGVPIPCPLSRPAFVVGIGTVLTWLVWARCTQVLHGTSNLARLPIPQHLKHSSPESLLVFPTLGIQLETHLGHPFFPPFFTTHHFIPLSALEDVIIHEGFRRWGVRYYLAALQRTGMQSTLSSASSAPEAAAAPGGVVEVRVAFEVRPHVLSVPPTHTCIHARFFLQNLLPYFPILKAVYLGVQETLFPPPTRVVELDR